jgi:O-antigen ligase
LPPQRGTAGQFANQIMFGNINALIYVLALGLLAFQISQRLADRMIAHSEFVTWRNAWFAVTIAAFLCQNFLVFEFVILMICLYAYLAHRANVGLFLVLLFAAPLGVAGISASGAYLLEINNGRLLGIVLLCPILFGKSKIPRGALVLPDWLVVGYATLIVALAAQQYSLTAVMRGAVTETLDVLIPYFAFSRTVTSMAEVRKVFLAFVVALLPLSMMAPLELVKGWHLYGSVIDSWGMTAGAIRRGDLLRASTIALGAITLGTIIMVAIGCFLALWQRTIRSRQLALVVLAIFATGLIAALSRGPWIGTLVLVLVYLAISPNSIANLGKFATISVVVLLPLSLTPVGQRLLEFLPFVGSIDTGSLTYRQRLFENALVVIERSPWIGSVNYLSAPEMQELIQGEGIVDVVNTYLGITLYSGLLGLSLFVSFFATILTSLRRVTKIKLAVDQDIEFRVYARISIATLLGILVTIGTTSSGEFVTYLYWSFAGLCVALVRIADRQRNAWRMRPQMIASG